MWWRRPHVGGLEELDDVHLKGRPADTATWYRSTDEPNGIEELGQYLRPLQAPRRAGRQRRPSSARRAESPAPPRPGGSVLQHDVELAVLRSMEPL